jgi:hypothetical protein
MPADPGTTPAALAERELLAPSDGIYNQGGSELLLTPTASGTGYAAAINIGMDVSA